MRVTSITLGLDFDNTIVLYDSVFRELATEAGLLPTGFVGGKRAVRDHIRTLPDGEVSWTRLQAQVYGPGIARAEPAPGLVTFLNRCRVAGIEPAIVSHKTRFAAADPGGTDLRQAAQAWITAHGLTDPTCGGIAAQNIFFESTRAEKINRICALGCTHFVDDLDEVFREPAFPHHVQAYLYAPADMDPPVGPWRSIRSWGEVADDLFG
jgi:hypothetical protein